MLLNACCIQILECFLTAPLPHVGTEIARLKKLSQKTVANTLLRLEKEGLFISHYEGKNKLYVPHWDNKEILAAYLAAAEHFRTLLFYKQQPFMREVVSKIIPHIEGFAAIFGSYAKGTATKDSDLDLFIAGTYDADKIRNISATYGVIISVKNYPSRLENKTDFLLREILRNHILIKGVELFLDQMLPWTR